MSAENNHSSSCMTRARFRRARRSSARAESPRYSWLACAAGLMLCLTGCPTQESAKELLEQSSSDALLEGISPASSPDASVSSVPSAKEPAAERAISSIEPTQGPSGGGTRVTLRGTDLSGATHVFFGDVAASNVTVVDAQTVTMLTPAHPEGVVRVWAEMADGAMLGGPQGYSYLSGACPNYDPSIDTDDDGLADGLERCGWQIAVDLYGFGSDNPAGLYYTRVASSEFDPDTDDDGLSDYEEYLAGSDPRDPDTDDDGLGDAEEVQRWLSSPVSVDSDGDANGDNDALPPDASLFDGAELKIDFVNDPTHTPAIDATSPTSDDTDGDGRSDYEELDHPVLSPVIADLPALELEVVDEIDVLLNVEYAEEAGTSTEYGTSFSQATTTSEHWYTGGSMQVGMGASVTVGAKAEAGFPGGVKAEASAEATVSMEVSYSQEWQVGGEKSEELRNEYSRLQGKSRTHTETVSSGAISTGIVLTNTGPVSYHLTDLGMTVRLFERGIDPDDPLYVGSFKSVATLMPVLGENGFTLAPGQSTPVLQVQAQNVNVDRVKDFLRDPHALHLEQAYFEMETAQGLNYGFIEEATQASTATITVDFGDGEWHKYRLATNVNRDASGDLTGVRMADALAVLGIGFQTAMKYADPAHTVPICRVLTHVQKEDGTWLPEDPDPYAIDRYATWVAFGTNEDFANETLDFEDVVLHAGDAATLVFSLDADHDGVYGWEEDHYGSSDDAGNADYDGDGLTDNEEVCPQDDGVGGYTPAGWDVQVGDDPPYRAFSDPRLADGDEDGLNDLEEKLGRDGFPPGDASDTGDATDPNKRDTDGDGINDDADPWPLDPAHILRVDDDSEGGDGSTWESAYSSLETAIGVAQSANGDTDPTNDVTEIWVAAGNYTFTEQQPLLSNVGIYGGFGGAETKRAQRVLSYGSVIDGTGEDNRAFGSDAAVNAVLDGFQINNWSFATGGAVYSDAGDLTVRNIWFIGNGVANSGSGGALYITSGGDLLVENCIFAGNVAQDGGAVATFGAASVFHDCRFENNQTTRQGGAIYASGGRLGASGTTFLENRVDETQGSPDPNGPRGGAICCFEADEAELVDCSFIGHQCKIHTADDGFAAGGGAWLLADYIAVTNCLFLSNVVIGGSGTHTNVEDGCGLFTAGLDAGSKACVTNCTFVGNSREGYYGAALQMWGAGHKQVVNVVSAFNSSNESNIEIGTLDPRVQWYGAATSPGSYFVRDICTFPLIDNGDGWDDKNINDIYPQEVIKVDPGFVDYANGDVHLLDTSPLIDIGYNYVDIDPVLPGIQFLPEYDLDGRLRIVDGDHNGVATVDIGAYEYSPY